MNLDTLPMPIALPAARPGRGGQGVLLLVLLLGLLAANVGLFILTGGHWYVVRTPSMGSAAPVGSLVATRPTSVSQLHVGDIISFHPPTDRSETYTHRIISIHDGVVRTKGDINRAHDPWLLTKRDIIGRVRVIVPGLGWLVRALPMIAVAIAVVWLATARIRVDHRRELRMLGVVGALVLAVIVLRPLLGVTQLQTVNGGNGTGSVTVVSTGLLPVRIESTDGSAGVTPVNLGPGQVGTVHISAKHGREFHLQPRLHLTGWSLAAAIGVCSAPTLWALLIGFGVPPEPSPKRERRQRRCHVAFTKPMPALA